MEDELATTHHTSCSACLGFALSHHPLAHAVEANNEQAVAECLRADIRCARRPLRQGLTVWHIAAQKGREAILRLLVATIKEAPPVRLKLLGAPRVGGTTQQAGIHGRMRVHVHVHACPFRAVPSPAARPPPHPRTRPVCLAARCPQPRQGGASWPRRNQWVKCCTAA